ncbi:hypothetical protein ACFLWU_05870 [Chloroflexota bacterium]
MKWKYISSLIICIILALVLVIIGSIAGSTILYAFALGVISVGLGVNSLMISLNTDKRMDSTESTLARLETLQEEIKKAQEEQPGSNKPLLATLQALSQYYLDYKSEQKKENEPDK